MPVHPRRLGDPHARCPRVRDPALNELIEKAWTAGWWCERRTSGHVMCYSPDGAAMVLVACTPSDRRTISNTRAALRRAGLAI
ncbi:MAG: hypothetical protein WBQ14_03590 [Gaiellaceae bacterium]